MPVYQAESNPMNTPTPYSPTTGHRVYPIEHNGIQVINLSKMHARPSEIRP